MAQKLKVYFACSIKGAQDGLDTKEVIIKILKDLGHKVLSEILSRDDQNIKNGVLMSDKQIFLRDMRWVEQADVVVAALGVSFGVGYEIGWFDRGGGKVVALIRGDKDIHFSSMGKGNNHKNFHLHYWQTEEDVKKILEKELGKVD